MKKIVWVVLAVVVVAGAGLGYLVKTGALPAGNPRPAAMNTAAPTSKGQDQEAKDLAAQNELAKARQMRDTDNLDEAIAIAEKIAKDDPRNISATLLLSEFSISKGDLAKAKSWADKGLDIDPNSSWAMRTMGSVCVAQGKSKAAEEYFLRAIKEGDTRDNAASYFSLSQLYESQKNIKMAMECMRKAFANDPENTHFGQEVRRLEELVKVQS